MASAPLSSGSQNENKYRSFSIAFINCNGLEHKLRQPRKSEDHMEDFINKHDFVGLNEVRLREPSNKHPVDGYTLLYKPKNQDQEMKKGNKPKKRISGGVGLLVRNELMEYCKQLTVNDHSSVWCYVAKDVYGFDFTLAVQYVHQNDWSSLRVHGKGGRNETKKLRKQKFFEWLNPSDIEVHDRRIIMGDFNTYHFFSHSSEFTDDRLKILNEQKERFGEKVTRSTCHQRPGGTVIDYAFASPKMMEFIQDFEVLPFKRPLSDYHSALVLSLVNDSPDKTLKCIDDNDINLLKKLLDSLQGIETILSPYDGIKSPCVKRCLGLIKTNIQELRHNIDLLNPDKKSKCIGDEDINTPEV